MLVATGFIRSWPKFGPAKKISSGTAKLKMLNEKRAVLSSKDGKVKINQANILKADIMAKNGIIHIIDEVLLPQE